MADSFDILVIAAELADIPRPSARPSSASGSPVSSCGKPSAGLASMSDAFPPRRSCTRPSCSPRSSRAWRSMASASPAWRSTWCS
jgi:hypothetical protein